MEKTANNRKVITEYHTIPDLPFNELLVAYMNYQQKMLPSLIVSAVSSNLPPGVASAISSAVAAAVSTAASSAYAQAESSGQSLASKMRAPESIIPSLVYGIGLLLASKIWDWWGQEWVNFGARIRRIVDTNLVAALSRLLDEKRTARDGRPRSLHAVALP